MKESIKNGVSEKSTKKRITNNIFTEMIDSLKKRDKKEEKWSKVYGGEYKKNIYGFFGFMIKFLNLEEINKKYEENGEVLNRTFLFGYHSEDLNYIEYIFKEIKRFLPLIFKISQDFWLVDKLEKSNLKDESIIKMIENFVSLKSPGRPRKFENFERGEFRKLLDKYENVLTFCKEIDSWDGEHKGSMMDFAKAIEEYKITKKELLTFEGDFNYYLKRAKKWSRATKYRFDKNLFKIEKLMWIAKSVFDNYNFYKKILQE